MADERRDSGASSTAIVAVVAMLLVAAVVFMLFFWNGGETEEPIDEPDIELQIDPPAEGNGEGGGAS